MTELPPLPASKVLLGGRTLLLLPSLVGMVGLNEAIVLQQVRYRLGDDLRPRVRDGRRWVRDTLDRWRERDFPFWEIDTLRRAFQSLEERGLLLSEQFEKHLRDRTKWYTIDFAALERREREYRAARAGTAPPPAKRRAARPPGRAGEAANAATASAGETLPPLPASDLLIDEPPLLVVVELAVAIGLDEALILQQIRYWLADERRPPVRDGRRWVCPREVACFAPLAFRSEKTLARALRALEHSGLLLASARFNRLPGDRTKWYTIDFARVAALVAPTTLSTARTMPDVEPEGQFASIQEDNRPPSNGTECQHPTARSADIEPDDLPSSNRTECAAQMAILQHSFKDSETDAEIKREEQQQREGTVVVVASLDPDSRTERLLRERGITMAVARDLAQRFPAQAPRQIEVYDWLRERDPDDDRLTPGRLRRMVEDDWAPPPEFIPAAERAAAHAAALAASAPREVAAAARDTAAAAHTARGAALARIGVREADQAVWQSLVVQPPALPRFLAAAYFCPPPPGARTVALIFDDAAACARVAALPAAIAANLRERLARRYGLPALDVAHFVYAELLGELAGEDDTAIG